MSPDRCPFWHPALAFAQFVLMSFATLLLSGGVGLLINYLVVRKQISRPRVVLEADLKSAFQTAARTPTQHLVYFVNVSVWAVFAFYLVKSPLTLQIYEIYWRGNVPAVDRSTLPDYVLPAIPFFFLFIGLEMVAHFFRGDLAKVYRLNDGGWVRTDSQ